MTTRSISRITFAALGLFIAAIAFSPRAEGQAKEDKKLTYPRQILIIRHAEKLTGDAKSPELAPDGKERAAILEKIFEKSEKRPMPFPTPDFIFAAKNSEKSHRPVLTVTPLAKKLKLPINSDFNNDDPTKIADEIFGNAKYADKTVLISWRHNSIIPLAQKLKATGLPESWKDEVYDRVWQITYDEKGNAKWVDRPQQLMPKDPEK